MEELLPSLNAPTGFLIGVVATEESKRRDDERNVREVWKEDVVADWRKARIEGARILEVMAFVEDVITVIWSVAYQQEVV